jgi:hypothetical protein
VGMLQTLQVVSTAINSWISPPISEKHLRNHGKSEDAPEKRRNTRKKKESKQMFFH